MFREKSEASSSPACPVNCAYAISGEMKGVSEGHETTSVGNDETTRKEQTLTRWDGCSDLCLVTCDSCMSAEETASG